MTRSEQLLLSGDEAVALAARDAGVALATGYPGTPSTEILEHFAALDGRSQWAPNEKVALEVAIGVAFAGARALVTMKHVGLNVAADPLFTAAYTGVHGALVVVSADDPGMASSQNEQDNRRYALAAGVPMLEPADSQEAYDFTLAAIEVSERWRIPVLLRMTTRVCHSKTVVRPAVDLPAAPAPGFVRDIRSRVMIPAYARPAHQRLREKLAEIAQWNETSGPTVEIAGGQALGIITSGVSYVHVREAAPEASVLKLGMTYPVPLERVRRFAAGVARTVVIEEGDPYLVETLRTARIAVEGRPEMYRFGELNVARVRRILAGDTTPEPAPAPGKPPQLCPGCPHRNVFTSLRNLDCIVSGDIGCYTLGVLPPFEAMDSLVCMGASHRRGPWAAARAAGRRGAPRGERHRRQHVRPQRHHRPGRDGLQPAADRPRGADSRQRHHGHDRHAGTSRHGPRSRTPQNGPRGLRGPGARAGRSAGGRDRSERRSTGLSGPGERAAGLAGAWR